MAKKYDPLWEIVGEQVPLQGTEAEAGVLCPVCHVRLDVTHMPVGATVECGLCGAALVVSESEGSKSLEREAAGE